MFDVKAYIKDGTTIRCDQVYAKLNFNLDGVGYYLDREDYGESQDFACFSTGIYLIHIDDHTVEKIPYVLIPENQFDQLTEEDLADIWEIDRGRG